MHLDWDNFSYYLCVLRISCACAYAPSAPTQKNTTIHLLHILWSHCASLIGALATAVTKPPETSRNPSQTKMRVADDSV